MLPKYRFQHLYQKIWMEFPQRKGYNMSIVWTGRKSIGKMVIFLRGNLVSYREMNRKIKILLVGLWLMKSVKKYNSICLKVDISFDLSSFIFWNIRFMVVQYRIISFYCSIHLVSLRSFIDPRKFSYLELMRDLHIHTCLE